MIVVGDMPIDVALRKFRKMYADKLFDYKEHMYYVSKGEKRRAKRQRALKRRKR